ncbi:hypothetical protein D5H75_40490 [Bailinhaonella thermotolerans]|uniref:Uncharacterized protein n=1 Tax=Bailinhaonella thermotolerans TaxID=1070861 RepID=A0A3A3ZZA5_9ACTN|nr:hypothetical protein D5H75_40490 [Bailinhaonella thermotolerans]
MTLTEQERRDALVAGRFAGSRGLPVAEANPYVGDDPRSRALRLLWVRAYLRAAPHSGVVDYTA